MLLPDRLRFTRGDAVARLLRGTRPHSFRKCPSAVRQTARHLNLEHLEPRALLSATMQFEHVLYDPRTGATLNSAFLSTATQSEISPLGSIAPPGSALTPAKIRTAYGITGIAGDGTGQTIAIVDAFQNPNIASDLQAFDAYYGLANPPSFQQLNENGSTNLSSVPTDSTGGWEEEEALDVESAHAIAPGANIVLVAANSAYDTDLYTAVSTAAGLADVSVVSMSWSGPESSNDPSSNAVFTAPSGHTGVTFFSATGDSGSPSGYPAYSPNVVAVGGTTLTLSGNNYSSESGWSGSGGGISVYEAQPAYQQGLVIHNGTLTVNANGKRANPDVSFDADPNSGVSVYDSYNGGSAPWYQIGGTSLATPCWAALVAIANQLRANQGLTPLDGVSQTLPKLYSLAADFHNITSGSNGGYSAGTGYDLVTGLGSPVANLLVPALAVPPAPDLTVAKTHVGNFHPGDVGDTYTITVSNVGGSATSGMVSVVDALPAGLTATNMSGSGWTLVPGTLTATRTDALAAGAATRH